ncbi:MAG: threonylcarbamoyl-AMP synthase [Bacteroidetes bacterium]|nr:threonylcarbamoyl-AMP synthase [Bacteroidota bacterium]
MADIGNEIAIAKALLEEGKLVAIPTETVYGLAGNALNEEAVTEIYLAKNRPYFDPLIVHVGSVEAVSDYVEEIPRQASELMRRFWPGPLTILLPKKSIVPDLVTAGLDRVGIRCPDHPLTLQLLKKLSFPLAAPSANPFGYVSPTNPAHVNEQLGNKIDYILDGGECKVGVESTIVGFENGNSIVYRVGGLSVEDIESVIGKVIVNTHSDSNPQAPGQLTSHYAPGKPLLLGNIQQLYSQHKNKSMAVLSYRDEYELANVRTQIVLSPSGNLDEAARKLFSALRELDKLDVEMILTEEVPDIGLGRAINDRLRRASNKS